MVSDGHALVDLVLAEEFALAKSPLFVIRSFMGLSSYGTGTAGCKFASLLALGVLTDTPVG